MTSGEPPFVELRALRSCVSKIVPLSPRNFLYASMAFKFRPVASPIFDFWDMPRDNPASPRHSSLDAAVNLLASHSADAEPAVVPAASTRNI